MVELIDFTATAQKWAELKIGYTHFGKDLTNVLAGNTSTHRDAVFCEGGRMEGESHCAELPSAGSAGPENLYWPRVHLQREVPAHSKAVMCRTERYKYVRRYYESDELYDLQTDPNELDNRIDDPALAEIRQQLSERMLNWYMATCDVVPFEPDQRGF